MWFHLEMGGEILLYDAEYRPLDVLNRPPLALANAAHLPELPFELEGDGVFVEAFKRAEKSTDRILRLGEVRGDFTPPCGCA